jgi:hypothetical protein
MIPLEANSLTTASVSTHIEAVGHLRPVEQRHFLKFRKKKVVNSLSPLRPTKSTSELATGLR